MIPRLLRTFAGCQNTLAALIFARRFSTTDASIAVLYQAIDPPMIGGLRKPKKPGGYQDSGADIAYVLDQRGFRTILPDPHPDPTRNEGWSFADSESDILSAVKQGANTLWANTILFESHPIQKSARLGDFATQLRVIGQPPALVEAYDDKALVNNVLADSGSFTIPKFFLASSDTGAEIPQLLNDHGLSLPVIAKPVRGRGSHGVRLCRTVPSLADHCSHLWKESPLVIVEEYLAGPEATVTVMPPSPNRNEYWALPIVSRFNHDEGIAPYNGTVAVTANSKVVSKSEYDQDPAFARLSDECERVAKLLRVTAPIRIDVRRTSNQHGAAFALFDVNMKPNMTAPGRPGREDQASLTAMAASGLGWDAPTLLERILETASTLETLRATQLPIEFAKALQNRKA
ncbi:hypothetical protein KVT40_000568 [Elsinoe batatas]|uniref:ATP-grasp domain-containing protein n=1 Tax=Elsinoe batatas TaxID=2601811 RepID=A0A8K0LB70_9PEZI|nr:hypothetical protein KVT40_000568 [Elsinoe batatas]